jgi:hypothetical protein
MMEPQRTQGTQKTARTLTRPQVNSLTVVALFAQRAVHGARAQDAPTIQWREKPKQEDSQ